MSALFPCGHPRPAGTPERATGAQAACRHLLERPAEPHRWYRADPGQWDLLCDACRQLEAASRQVFDACEACLDACDQDHDAAGHDLGRVVTRTRDDGLVIRQETTLSLDLAGPVAAMTPAGATGLLVLETSGRLLRVDGDRGVPEDLGRIQLAGVDLAGEVWLVADPTGRFVAVAATKGSRAAVLDLDTGEIPLALDRGEYHVEHCRFPLAFAAPRGRTVLVHGSAWNRLDISDPETGRLLTPRAVAPYPSGGPRPEHYLDYFHCGLAASPGGRWLVDDGWAWHPVGILRVLDLRRWLTANPFESEDGPSIRDITQRPETWDGPLAFLDEDRLAIWGLDLGDGTTLDGVVVHDLATGDELRRFPGPGGGALVAAGWLFSLDPTGLTAWDPGTGERVLQVPDLRVDGYHPGGAWFYRLDPGGTLRRFRVTGPAPPAPSV